MGITVSDSDVTAGMDEFRHCRAICRPTISSKGIAQNEVDPKTFRRFVKAGLLWRRVVQACSSATSG